ncbi:MAG: ABC transporter permease [Granulosicoccus sp.]
MKTLLIKEWRQLFPIACLWLALLLLGYFMQFATERVDEKTFSGWCDVYCDVGSDVVYAIVSIIIAMITAYSLFPREHDDATIDFLRALPISRKHIFIAKFMAAWLLLCSVSLLSFVIDAFVLKSNPESIGGRFYYQVWFTLLWRDFLFMFVILSHGVLLSWFRTLGLVVYAIYLIALMWMESRWGSSGIWSVFSMLSNQYDGSQLLVNQRSLIFHSMMALAVLAIAYRLWGRTESSVMGSRNPGVGLRLMQGVFTAVAFIGVAGFLFYQVNLNTGNSDQAKLRVVSTEHYRFVYPSDKEATVQYILSHAESDYLELVELLGVDTDNVPDIRVDLSAQSEHAAGLATWKKILMDLNSFSDDISQRRVLSHETTHVLQSVESDRALMKNHSAVKFFIEGMAQYTSFEVVPEQIRRELNWELASVSWERQGIEFRDLIDAAGFAEKYDVELHYSLGDIWTSAFVDVCGSEALGEFIRATGREGLISSLPAEIFWRTTMQYIGCDLDTVNEHWRTKLEEVYEQVPKTRFPVYSDVVVRRDDAAGMLKITASLESDGNATGEFDQPTRFIVRVRRSSHQLSSGVDPLYRGRLLPDSENGSQRIQFQIPLAATEGSRFRYQLGYSPSEESRYYYGIWRRGSL